MNARALAWSLDFAAGILIFVAALLLTTGILVDSFHDRTFSFVHNDANALAKALFSEGYPRDWDVNDVIQAGLLWDGRLSERKLEALARMTAGERARILPSSYRYAIVVTDVNGTVQGIGPSCIIGADEYPVTAHASVHGRRLAYYARASGPQQLRAFAENRSAALYFDENFTSLIDDGFRYGMILFEDPRLDLLLSSTLSNESSTEATLRESLRTLAEYGALLVLTGDAGIPILGSNTTLNATAASTVVAYEDPYVTLESGATIDFDEKTTTLTYLPEGIGTLGNRGGAEKPLLLLASTANQTTAARWQYQDSIVYYFQDTKGVYTNSSGMTDWADVLEGILAGMATLSTNDCTIDPATLVADNLITVTRVTSLRGVTRIITFSVWSG